MLASAVARSYLSLAAAQYGSCSACITAAAAFRSNSSGAVSTNAVTADSSLSRRSFASCSAREGVIASA